MVDNQTGEVISSTTTSVYSKVARPERNFSKWIENDLSLLADCNRTELMILLALGMRMDFKNRVYLSPGLKKVICVQCGIFKGESKVPSVGWLNDCLYRMCKKRILAITSRSEYMVNPNLFGKGPWSDISSLIDEFNQA